MCMATKKRPVKSSVKSVSTVKKNEIKIPQEEKVTVEKKNYRFVPSEKFIVPVILLLILIVVLVTGYTTLTKNETTSQAAPVDQRELSKLIDKVGDHILLPEGEQATIATVSDKTKLQDQEFFKRAENGDKVLIYTKAKKAILYRPSVDKVIEIGPVFEGQVQEEVAGASESVIVPEVKVALYNGTTTSGLTNNAEADLSSLQSVKATVIAKENASRSTYDQTVVIDVTGKNTQAVKDMADLFQGSVATLPTGESTPSADILVILGSTYSQ